MIGRSNVSLVAPSSEANMIKRVVVRYLFVDLVAYGAPSIKLM